jgi:hypothetical protein
MLHSGLLITVALFAGAAPAAADDGSACVASAASAAFPRFLAQVPAEHVADVGFASERALRLATLGAPYRLHLIRPQALRAHAPGASVRSLLTESGQWYVPVLVDAQPVAFLVVEQRETGCEAVSLGYARLAAGVAGAVRGGGWIARGRPKLVASLQAQRYFLADPDAEPRRLRALTAAPGRSDRPAVRALAAGPDREEDLDEVVTRLRPAVEASVAGEAR